MSSFALDEELGGGGRGGGCALPTLQLYVTCGVQASKPSHWPIERFDIAKSPSPRHLITSFRWRKNKRGEVSKYATVFGGNYT